MHGDFFRLLLRHLAHPDRRERAVFQNGQMREEIEVLEHHADFAAHFIDLLEIVGQLDIVDDDLALLVFFQTVDTADHGRFARARRSGNNDALPAHDLQIDVAQDVKLTIPLMHIGDFDGDIGCGNLHLRTVNIHSQLGLREGVLCTHFHYSLYSYRL